MHDRQTKTIVQVCRGADQIEKAPGPSKLTFCGGGGGQPTWAIEKNEKYDGLRDGRHMRQGQDRKLYPNLPLIGEVLHCNTPPTPKSGLERGWSGRFKKERPIHSFFRPIDTSAES